MKDYTKKPTGRFHIGKTPLNKLIVIPASVSIITPGFFHRPDCCFDWPDLCNNRLSFRENCFTHSTFPWKNGLVTSRLHSLGSLTVFTARAIHTRWHMWAVFKRTFYQATGPLLFSTTKHKSHLGESWRTEESPVDASIIRLPFRWFARRIIGVENVHIRMTPTASNKAQNPIQIYNEQSVVSHRLLTLSLFLTKSGLLWTPNFGSLSTVPVVPSSILGWWDRSRLPTYLLFAFNHIHINSD